MPERVIFFFKAIFKQILVISFRLADHQLFFIGEGALDKIKLFSDREETYVFNIGIIYHKDHSRQDFLNDNGGLKLGRSLDLKAF